MPTGRTVLLANPRGFCAGVRRAVDMAESLLRLRTPPVYGLHEIVHNRYVVDSLKEKGAVFVEELDEVPDGVPVVFSAHGVPKAVPAEASSRGLDWLDATCPLVGKVHSEARRFAERDYDIVLIGHADHEEVEGTMGHAPERTILVNGPEEADVVEVEDPTRLVWLSQTTLSVDETMETVRRLRARFPHLQDPPSDDICYATQNRQVAIKKVAAGADLVIVVGSVNSSNTVRLVDVALARGAKAAHRVDYAEEIDPAWLEGVGVVGGVGRHERHATSPVLPWGP